MSAKQRLARLEQRTFERQWTREQARLARVADDLDWWRIVGELNALERAVQGPPPATFRLYPPLVLFASRKRGVTPDAYRWSVWRQRAVLATPAGDRLYHELLAIEARYRPEADAKT